MDNRKEEITVLNELLQGAYIGIDSYAKCLNNIKDEDIRHKLEHLELEQREIAMETASRIRDLGGTPKENPGTKGAMASIMGSLKVAGNENTLDMLNILSNGTKMGIDSLEKSLPRLHGPSKELIEKHLKEDKKSFKEIENLKGQMVIH